MRVHEQIGANVLRLRKARRLRQVDLARRAQISLMTLSNVEHGRQNLTIEALDRLATALGVGPGDLLAPIGSHKS